MRELSVLEINSVSGGGPFLDASGYGAGTGTLIGLAEAGLAGQGGLAAATTIGSWGVIGGALALEGYVVYEVATYAGAGYVGETLGGWAYDFTSWIESFF